MEKTKVEWTPAQLLAQRKRGNTLVSAAAGSGKTAVLIEKIMRLLTVSGRSLGEMLIVTYTKNAAEELKVKIGQQLAARISEDPSAARHLNELPRAVIGTIHSFLLKVVRENYSALGLPPGISVISEGDLKTIKTSAADEAFDELFSTRAGSVPGEMSISEVCDVIGNADAAEACVTAVYEELRCHGLGIEKITEYADRLEEWADRDFLASPWGGILRDEFERRSKRCRELMEALVPEMAVEDSQKKNVIYADRFFECLDILDRALKECEIEGILRAASAYKSLGMRLANNSGGVFVPSARFRAVRDEIVSGIFRHPVLASDAEGISASMKRTARFVRGFGRAVGAYGEIFEAKKRERGGVDYQDLETFAVRLFIGDDGEPTDIARKIGERFPFIFVDEYQDANRVQDEIFRAIGGASERFLVGDVKQSIYRFRGGEPEVFSGYREKWENAEPQDGDGDVTEPRDAGVFMSTNFRCSEQIVDFSNAVSRLTFPYSRVPFCRDDELIFGAKKVETGPVTVCLLEKKDGALTEEEYTAATIRSMIGTDPFGTGALKPSDFAILLARNDLGKGYADALEAAGIPSTLSLGVDLSQQSEIILALDILRAVDNPFRDGPLAGMMYSSIGGFSLDDLVRIREKYRDGPLYSAVLRTAADDAADAELRTRCSDLISRLARYRSAEKSAPANVFVEYIFDETGIMNSPEVTEKINGADRVRTLLDLARKYEDGESGGLFGFLNYIDLMIDAGEFFYMPEKTGAVRIMTIHKSKGLEFPVCFIGKTAKEYVDKGLDNSFQFDRVLGIGSVLPGGGGYTRYDTVIRKMIVSKKRTENREEQMRVLYVAMTRAKYKLFITATGDPDTLIKKARENDWRRDPFSVGEVNKFIDHILSAAYTVDPAVCKVEILTEEGGINPVHATAAAGEDAAVLTAEAAEAARRAKENFEFEYPFSFLSNLPSKLAVSKLYPEVLDEGEAALPEDGEFVLPDGDMPYPTFMTGTTDNSPAEKGTANHVFMQFCDFDRLAEGAVREEIERLVSKGFMTAKMAELVEEDFIDRFIRGGLFARMRDAAEMRREFRFNVRLPAAKFTSDGELAEKFEKADARVTVQGVFDCVFREKDGTLVLVDYKTDAMTPYDRSHPEVFAEKLRERHKAQLSYYREAAALIFGRAPDETLIWSLPMGEAIEIG